MLTRTDDQKEKVELLSIISQRIEQRQRLESQLGVDLHKIAGLPELEDLKRGLEILRRELARKTKGGCYAH